jgi:hypothetical protein
MNRYFISGLVSLGLNSTHVLSAAEIPTDATALGKVMCESVDLGTPGYERMREHAKNGRFAEALNAWRDRKVLEFRQADLGEFGWHGDQLNGRRLSCADQLVGKTSVDGRKNPGDDTFFSDIYGMRQAGPGAPPIDWLAKDANGKIAGTYSHFFFGIPFGARYWQTGDPVYVERFFLIAGDFAVRQKGLVEKLPAEVRKTFVCGWTQSPPSALAQGTRVMSLIRTVGLMCKSLPDKETKAKWEDVLAPRTSILKEGTEKTVPAGGLAQVALSLVNDHTPALLERYMQAGSVPNQRRCGLGALVLIGTQFPEFKTSKTVLTQSYEGLKDYLEGTSQRDGGMLEQSFNYNLFDALGFGELAILLKVRNPELAALMLEKQMSFYRMAGALITPFGVMPAMSSMSPPNPPEIWKDTTLRQRWMAKALQELKEWKEPLAEKIANTLVLDKPAAVPGFTSVAFPFSGYYVQRGGWNWQSPYLFFQGSRQSRGHHTLGNNAIQVSAYGRPLIVSAGVPAYGAEQLPPERRQNFEEINELLGEDSTWKVNTVLVDHSSQKPSATIAQTAFPTPVVARWHTSPAFDYLEGFTTSGYVAQTAKDVRHMRQVVFVRDPGLWVVVDVMLSADSAAHTYTQNWILPGNERDDKTPVTGFRKADVTADESSRVIRTNDLAGPNLTLRHVGLRGGQLKYVHHYGDKKPWRGWFATTFGRLLPAHQIEANFTATGNATLITILQPRQTGDATDLVVTDGSEQGSLTSSACKIRLSNGRVLSVFARDSEGQIQAPPFNGNAQLVVTLERTGGNVEGLVITKRESQGSFAFNVRPGQPALRTPILSPTNFQWTPSASGIAPLYSGVLNDPNRPGNAAPKR